VFVQCRIRRPKSGTEHGRCFSPARLRPNTTHVYMGHGPMASLARLEPKPCWPLELQGPLHLSLVVRYEDKTSLGCKRKKWQGVRSQIANTTKHALEMPTSLFSSGMDVGSRLLRNFESVSPCRRLHFVSSKVLGSLVLPRWEVWTSRSQTDQRTRRIINMLSQ
jgi:hypothetical protein